LFIEKRYHDLVYMTAPNIEATHAFTTRYGGVSRGVFDSLNLGLYLGDDPDHVKDNFRSLCDALGISGSDIVRTRQVHTANIRVVTRDDRGGLFNEATDEADGLITRDTGVALMIFIADCVPILLHDDTQGAVGAVHAGWRGTALDIAGAAVRKMSESFGCIPDNIRAAIGPCVSKCCYETDSDVADALYEALGEPAENCISGHGGKYLVDLKEANRLLLTRSGLNSISVSDECTACRCDKYWSHRRSNGLRGSQAAIITLGARRQ